MVQAPLLDQLVDAYTNVLEGGSKAFDAVLQDYVEDLNVPAFENSSDGSKVFAVLEPFTFTNESIDIGDTQNESIEGSAVDIYYENLKAPISDFYNKLRLVQTYLKDKYVNSARIVGGFHNEKEVGFRSYVIYTVLYSNRYEF